MSLAIVLSVFSPIELTRAEICPFTEEIAFLVSAICPCVSATIFSLAASSSRAWFCSSTSLLCSLPSWTACSICLWSCSIFVCRRSAAAFASASLPLYLSRLFCSSASFSDSASPCSRRCFWLSSSDWLTATRDISIIESRVRSLSFFSRATSASRSVMPPFVTVTEAPPSSAERTCFDSNGVETSCAEVCIAPVSRAVSSCMLMIFVPFCLVYTQSAKRLHLSGSIPNLRSFR